jgi:hypothetical protein
MTARDLLRGLAVLWAIVVVLVAVLTAALQVPRWTFAVLAELSEAAVVVGQATHAHLTGRTVVITSLPSATARTAPVPEAPGDYQLDRPHQRSR